LETDRAETAPCSQTVVDEKSAGFMTRDEQNLPVLYSFSGKRSSEERESFRNQYSE
jgi:hypothetical protein